MRPGTRRCSRDQDRVREGVRHARGTRRREHADRLRARAQFNLLPDALRARAASRLAADVRERKHLTTGFLGTPYLLHVLSASGYLDDAYLLLERRDYPSWLYPVTKGATTIWERWDGIKPDGSFQDPGMNSFNHYAYGAVGEWMYRVMAGIEHRSRLPGYKHTILQPHPGGRVSDVNVSHEASTAASRRIGRSPAIDSASPSRFRRTRRPLFVFRGQRSMP